MSSITIEKWTNADWLMATKLVVYRNFDYDKNIGEDETHCMAVYELVGVTTDSQYPTSYGARFITESKKKNPSPVHTGVRSYCDFSKQSIKYDYELSLKDITCASCREKLLNMNLI